MRIRLTNPNLQQRADEVLRGEVNEISDLELLRHLCESEELQRMEFVRQENGADVVLSRDELRTALELGWEVRP